MLPPESLGHQDKVRPLAHNLEVVSKVQKRHVTLSEPIKEKIALAPWAKTWVFNVARDSFVQFRDALQLPSMEKFNLPHMTHSLARAPPPKALCTRRDLSWDFLRSHC